jgi:hypothetical protein
MKKHLLTLTIAALLVVVLPGCGDRTIEDDGLIPDPGQVDPDPETPAIDLDIPDVDGATIKGVVYCNNKPLENVVVSDGDKVVVTDENGRYYISSDKTWGSVFVSIPSGYFVDNEDNVWPKFYVNLTKGAKEVEQANFELIENDANDYVVIGLADLHIANIRQTIQQYSRKYLPDLNSTIDEYKSAGKKVYCITLGDESHDLYWYDYHLAIADTKPYIAKINADAIFNCMGNHDNDPYVADDFLSEHSFREVYGPTHYSFNIAGTHYVVLDNIVYKNVGGSTGTLGDRTYTTEITDDQITWLRNDLRFVDKTTPLVVCMHQHYYARALLYNGAQTASVRYSLTNYSKLTNCLSGYSTTILSGHAHVNSTMYSGNILEYNIGGANGSLWYTGQSKYGSNHLCTDGSIGGYFVMEKTGTDYTSYYKSIGYDRDYQFRTYDLNNSRITADKYCPASTDAKILAFNDKTSGDAVQVLDGYLTERTDNVIRVNVFGYDERWKIVATEGNQALTITRVNCYDPLHIISLGCKMLQNGESVTSGRLPILTSHMFDIQARTATLPVTITVTDQYGRTYTQIMTRPKELSTTME